MAPVVGSDNKSICVRAFARNFGRCFSRGFKFLVKYPIHLNAVVGVGFLVMPNLKFLLR